MKIILFYLFAFLLFTPCVLAQNYFPTENIRDSTGKIISPSTSGNQTTVINRIGTSDTTPDTGTVLSILRSLDNRRTAFGELSVAELSPVVQVQFPYNINLEFWEIRDNNGTCTVVDNKAKLSTGSAANQSCAILTKTPLKYNPGQGALVRFTAIYTTGVANSTQWVGIGDTSDGYFFGYNGATFGILRRQGGVSEVRRLKIDTKSTDADSITITLDGDTKAVTVTDATATDATTTANEIGNTDFSNVGEGWEVHSMGDNVFFNSFSDGAKSGTYSLTDATSAVGTFSQSLLGVNSTDNIINQASWNRDTLDGSADVNNHSGINLDPTKGNVYQIQYQWLGFGSVSFFVEHSEEGDLHLVHRIEYSNKNTISSINNPTLPLCGIAKNTSNTSDIVVQIGSMGGFVEGRDTLPGLPHTLSVEVANVGTTETPIMTLHSHDIYQGVPNRVKIKMTTGSVSVEGTKPSTIRIRKNATITGGSFSPLDSNASVIHTDISSTIVTGNTGTILYSQSVEKIGRVDIDLEKIGVTLNAPDFLTLSIEASSGSVDTVSTLSWQEQF